ncbi:addiction module toxin RelE [Caulobacter flavus]|uniref:Addiction module toxin RelE n=1 Tax=Caulobacter flavus TaxID=1679497 RepID=A0A2N5CW55_9CAUL|nr:type II toxin-antitoxin system RelE/ParE family toxin [Caulobacter flavus]AYV44956.1 addiction module toxin RelE [Caulobacter flavus]PLR18039.1 addiction module toxin RelE [Caulobacter flavus]
MNDRDPPAFKVAWSIRSRRDLEAIRAYIGQVRPIAAQRLALRLVTAVEGLAFHPHRGRPAGGDVRELVAIAPYVIRYRVKGGMVQIVRIKHGAERPD